MHCETIQLRGDGASALDVLALDPEISSGIIKRRPAVIVCPGGAYLTLAQREAEPVAARFLGLGYQAFILRYPTYFADHKKPTDPAKVTINKGAAWPEPIVDAMQAMAWVRAHADELCIDNGRVYMLGFSAGAHLTCSLAERFDDEELLARAGTDARTARPDAIVLSYPMLSADGVRHMGDAEGPELELILNNALFGHMKPTEEQLEAMRLFEHVRPDMPRTFIWHTTEDALVDPKETVAFATELLKAGVPCELHLFERGEHGQSLCDEASAGNESHINKEAAVWPALAHAWLELKQA